MKATASASNFYPYFQKTGDIEDFPGLDSLPVYQISRENGKIFLDIDHANELTNKRVKPMAERSDAEEAYVILGT